MYYEVTLKDTSDNEVTITVELDPHKVSEEDLEYWLFEEAISQVNTHPEYYEIDPDEIDELEMTDWEISNQ